MFTIDYNRNYVPRVIFWSHRRAAEVNEAHPRSLVPDRARDRPTAEGLNPRLNGQTAYSSSGPKVKSYAPIQAFVPYSVWHEPIVGLLVDNKLIEAMQQDSGDASEVAETQIGGDENETQDIDTLLHEASSASANVIENSPPAAPVLAPQPDPPVLQSQLNQFQQLDEGLTDLLSIFEPNDFISDPPSPAIFEPVQEETLSMQQRLANFHNDVRTEYNDAVAFLFKQVPPMFLVGNKSRVEPTLDIFCTNIETTAYFNYMHKYYKGCSRYHQDRCNSVSSVQALHDCGRGHLTVFSQYEISREIHENPFVAFDHMPLSNALTLGNNAIQRVRYNMLDVVNMDLEFSMPSFNNAKKIDDAMRSWMLANNVFTTEKYPYYNHQFFVEYSQKLVEVYSLVASIKRNMINHGFSYWRNLDTHDANKIVLCPESPTREEGSSQQSAKSIFEPVLNQDVATIGFRMLSRHTGIVSPSDYKTRLPILANEQEERNKTCKFGKEAQPPKSRGLKRSRTVRDNLTSMDDECNKLRNFESRHMYPARVLLIDQMLDTLRYEVAHLNRSFACGYSSSCV